MKAIFVHGDDYSAIHFQNDFEFRTIKSIIKEFPEGTFINNDQGEYDISVHEVGEPSPEFVKFIREEIQDYDDSKHSNFWLEDESL